MSVHVLQCQCYFRFTHRVILKNSGCLFVLRLEPLEPLARQNLVQGIRVAQLLWQHIRAALLQVSHNAYKSACTHKHINTRAHVLDTAVRHAAFALVGLAAPRTASWHLFACAAPLQICTRSFSFKLSFLYSCWHSHLDPFECPTAKLASTLLKGIPSLCTTLTEFSAFPLLSLHPPCPLCPTIASH